MALVEMRSLQPQPGVDLFAVRADEGLIAIHE